MKILCLDIGETTGIKYFDYDKNYILLNQDMSKYVIAEKESRSNILTYDLISLIEEHGTPDICVIEKFVLYKHRAASKIGSSFIEVENIGKAKILMETFKTPIIEQMAVNVKGAFPDSKLKQHKVYTKGSDHIRDATRHGLYFICFNSKKFNLNGGNNEN